MKKIIFGALLGIMMIIPIATTDTNSEAKSKPYGMVIDYNHKQSKKVCKASNIKLYFDNEKQCMRVKSFKKSKYIKLSKKIFKKTLDVADGIFCTFYLDGKKYKITKSNKSYVMYGTLSHDFRHDTSISEIINVAKPGVHTIKIGVATGKEELRYGFWYTGKINIKKKTDWFWNTKQNVTYNHSINSRLFNIEGIVPNFDAKMEVNVKYIFDKAHYIKDNNNTIKNVKDRWKLKTDADVYNFIYERVGKDLTITESVNVNKNRKDFHKPIKINISKNAAVIKAEKDLESYNITFPSGVVYTEKVFDKDITIWDGFRPEVTVKFYDRENGEYVSEFTRTVKDV